MGNSNFRNKWEFVSRSEKFKLTKMLRFPVVVQLLGHCLSQKDRSFRKISDTLLKLRNDLVTTIINIVVL